MIMDKPNQVQALTQSTILLYIQYSSIVLVWYDYFLTFPMEVRSLWGGRSKRPRLVILLYAALRYPLVANVLYLLAVTKKLPKCDAWYIGIGALSVIGRGAILIVFTLRTAAIYHNNRYIAMFLGTAALICIALDLTHVPGLRCSGSNSIPTVSTLLAIFVCVFEVLASGLMFLRAVQIYRSGVKVVDNGGLLGFVLQQGVIYFCAVFGWQIASVLLHFISPSSELSKFINALNLPFSCLLTARFLLGLRSWDARRSDETPEQRHGLHTISTLRFGGPVRNDTQEEDDNAIELHRNFESPSLHDGNLDSRGVKMT